MQSRNEWSGEQFPYTNLCTQQACCYGLRSLLLHSMSHYSFFSYPSLFPFSFFSGYLICPLASIGLIAFAHVYRKKFIILSKEASCATERRLNIMSNISIICSIRSRLIRAPVHVNGISYFPNLPCPNKIKQHHLRRIVLPNH